MSENNKKTALLGITGSGKTTRLIERYKQYVIQGINTNEILVMVRNRGQGILWREQLNLAYSSKLRITSYFGFVQEEIKRFWPLINGNISNPTYNQLEPTFITIEMAQFFMLQIVEESRRQGKLASLQTNNDRIAIELIHNMSKAAMAGVDFESIGELILNSRNKQDIRDKELFFQLQELCNLYIKKCKRLGVVDYALGVELYNRILLKEKVYNDYFLRMTRHIIVDDMEEAVVTEINMLMEWMDKVDSFTITYNTDGELGRALGACPELVEGLIIPKCQVHHFDKSFTGSDQLNDLSRVLTSEVEDYGSAELPQIVMLEKALRSEMLKTVGEKVLNLLDEGVSPSEIALISPTVDSVMAYYLENILSKHRVEITNLVRNKRLTDDAYVKALITVSCLAHPEWRLYPSNDNLDGAISMILDMDKIRSHLISSEISKKKPYDFPDIDELPPEFINRIGSLYLERYSLFRNWIMDYKRESPIPINRFLQRLFTEILVPLPDTEQHLDFCRQLIDNSGHFLRVMKSHNEGNMELDRMYMEFIMKGMKAAQSLIELRGKLHSRNVILTTPYTYLALKHRRRIQIWTDISSEDWYTSDVREIANPHVFHPHWDRSRIWTDFDNDKYRRAKGNILIRRLIRRCHSRIIFSRSQLSRVGHEQDGILSAKLDGFQEPLEYKE